MKTERTLEAMRGKSPNNVVVFFRYWNIEDESVDVALPAADLYEDWMGDCEHCPANDTEITVSEIECDEDQVRMHVQFDPEVMRFDTLMAILENILNLHR